MVVLSKSNLDELANVVLSDFYSGAWPEFEPIDIDRLAAEYLNLTVCYENLSSDGSILGVAAYGGCTLALPHIQIDLCPGMVLLDRSLISEDKATYPLEGRRRFTLAHECAHQILYRYESAISQEQICRPYSQRRAFSLRELKTHEDWNEWQANALGAALLMPKKLLDRALFTFANGEKLACFAGSLSPEGYKCLVNMSRFLGVSHTALMIRLKYFDYLEERRARESFDPLDAVL